MIHLGNNIDVLKQYPDNYFDSVVTDPPYGLGKEPDAMEVMQAWIKDGFYEVKGGGFMGKEWDAFVPQPLFWKEVYRVLKPGAHVLSFFGTRTYDWGVMAMRFAGFEVRDTIQWHYGSGFPKSHNISKAIDKLHGAEREMIGTRKHPTLKDTTKLEESANAAHGQNKWSREWAITSNSTDDAKNWDGWGSALKPATEPIVLARKPLEKGLSIAENVLKWGTGGINIDGSRIGFTDGGWGKRHNQEYPEWKGGRNFTHKEKHLEQNDLGRFPANLIMSHHPECECVGVKKVKSDGHHSYKIPEDGGLLKLGLKQLEDEGNKYGKDGKETVEDWNCHPDCPIKILDEQSGISKSTGGSGDKSMGGLGVNGKYGKYALNVDAANKGGLGDTGGASRFFYCAKASKSERNRGLEDIFKKSNSHPTVKPVKLMQYLVRLITPPNGIVLDPFAGSGTTAVAAKLESVQWVCIEQNEEYYEICKARLSVDAQRLENKYNQLKLF